MDERQQQIRTGAGLEESRLNTDFINFIQKWGGPFLLLCAALMGAWAGWNWWQQQKASKVDDAFAQYEAQISGGNPNPEALKAVAAEFEGVASVSLLARLDAADVYMGSVRSGLKAGRTLNPDGTFAAPEDALTQEERDQLIQQATDLYQQVFTSARAASGKGLLAIRAAYGLAAAAESKNDLAAARDHYEQIVQIAEANKYANHVAMARVRIEQLDELATPVTLIAQAELPARPVPPAPEAPVVPGDAGPLGPVAPESLPGLEAPANPFNPEGGGGGLLPPTPTPTPEPATPPAPEPGTEPGTEPATEPTTEPATEPTTPPATDPNPQPPPPGR